MAPVRLDRLQHRLPTFISEHETTKPASVTWQPATPLSKLCYSEPLHCHVEALVLGPFAFGLLPYTPTCLRWRSWRTSQSSSVRL